MAANVQDVFMLFGDSISQGGWAPGLEGFGQHLSHVYARKLDVLNRGLSGYNTEWALPVFEQCLAKQHEQHHTPAIKILTIWFGANDACIKPSPQHVPLPKFIENLKKLVHLVHSPTSPHYSPSTRIVLLTPPPANTLQREADLSSRDPPLKLDRLFETTHEYAEAVKRVAADEKVAVVDVWTDVWQAAGQKEAALDKFLVDGLHLNAEGYKLVYDELMNVIGDQYPEVHYSNLREVFAPWAEIDWQDPAQSLVRRPSA